MKILLTGATGFIGSELVKRLGEQAHEVISLVRYISGGRYHYYGKQHVVMADLRDREMLEKVVVATNPDIIINLAAQSAVAFSFANPADVIQTNLLGLVGLSEAARKCDNLKLFVHASTSEVYGRTEIHPTPEDAPLGATSPYAVSKMACEEYLRVLQHSYEFPMVIMRPFNTFGRGLIGSPHFVVERAITQALSVPNRINLHDPRPYRDFLFRDDHVNAYVKLVEAFLAGKPVLGETFNIASGRSWTIEEMAKTVARIVTGKMGLTIEAEFSEVPDRPLDIWKLEGDASKAREILGWERQYAFEEGLRKAVDEWDWTLSEIVE